MKSFRPNRRVALVTLAAAAAAFALPAAAQAAFPEKGQTIKVIVPFAAGGGVDNAARLVAEQLRKNIGVTVIVENKPGASGSLGGRQVQTAAPDGLTLLFSAATHIHAKAVLASVPYDPLTDFVPVARVGEAPLLLVIPPDRKESKLADVIAAVKARPDDWTTAIPAIGAPSHLATLLLAKQAGLKLSYVPYKGTQPALVDVAGGHVAMLLDSLISLQSLAKSSKVKPIAITSPRRSPLLPNVPTVQESGLPGYAYASWYGFWAPRSIPGDKVSALNKAINQAVSDLAKTSAFTDLGIDPVTETPEQFKKYETAQAAQGKELLEAAGVKPE